MKRTLTMVAVLMLVAVACYPTSDPSNTGGCTGTSYSDYTGAVTRGENGLVLDHLRIHDQLILTGDHQKLTNSCIEGNGHIGVVRVAGTNTLVDHVRVKRKHPSPDTCAPADPRNDSLPYECQGDAGVAVVSGPAVVSNTDVSDVQHGIDVEADDVTITFDLIHDLAYTTSLDHPDGIITQSCNDNLEFSANQITMGSGVTSTVAIYAEPDIAGACAGNGFNNVIIKGNWMHDGGDACIQSPDPAGSATNFQIVDNELGPVCVPGTSPHTNGWHNGLVIGTGNAVSGNTWHDDHTPANA
jgi:hypothetical protein